MILQARRPVGDIMSSPLKLQFKPHFSWLVGKDDYLCWDNDNDNEDWWWGHQTCICRCIGNNVDGHLPLGPEQHKKYSSSIIINFCHKCFFLPFSSLCKWGSFCFGFDSKMIYDQNGHLQQLEKFFPQTFPFSAKVSLLFIRMMKMWRRRRKRMIAEWQFMDTWRNRRTILLVIIKGWWKWW